MSIRILKASEMYVRSDPDIAMGTTGSYQGVFSVAGFLAGGMISNLVDGARRFLNGKAEDIFVY